MLAPTVTDTEDQIVDVFNSNGALTAAVHALENTVLMTLPDNPSWYTTIESELKSAQSQSTSWLTNTSPTLYATATQSYIDYANLFGPAAGDMETLVEQIQTAGNIPSAAQQSTLSELVQKLLSTASAQQSACAALQTEVNSLLSTLTTLQSEINTAINDGLSDEELDVEAIQDTQDDIDELMIKMTKKSTKAGEASFSANTDSVSAVASLTFKLAASEGELGPAVIGTMIYSDVELTLDVIYTDEVHDIVKKINADLATLQAEEMALALTQSVVTNLESLLDTIDAALETFTDLTTIWNEVVDDLTWMMVVLAQPQIDVSKIPALLDLSDAASAWSTISQYATWAQTQPISQTLSLPEQTVTSTQTS